MNYLLDTNILLVYLRATAQRDIIEQRYDPFGSANNPIISVVNVGEIKSIAKRNYWGHKRLALLDEILNELIITDINSEDVIEMYAEIDAFSQGKLKDKPLATSARNMGKNDLWIASTAAVIGATLLTSDRDFDHLHDQYLDVAHVEM